MTFEDGRKGVIRATVKLADARFYPVTARMPEAAE
jgi:long-chain acyl-CoA synthetase